MLINLSWILLAMSLVFLGIVYLKLNQRDKELLERDRQLEALTKEAGSLASNNALLSKNLADISDKLKKTDLGLQGVTRLKDDFVSIASHELRTPMAAIRSYAWMALNKSDMPVSERMKKYLVRILISTERLINLVNDLLNVSRIEAGKIDINPESVDLISLIKDVTDEIYYSKSTDKDIQFQLVEKPIPKVLADPERLREVMLNLVGNSAKFTPPGGTVTIEFFSDGKFVETSVKDTGIGFTRDDLSRLFQKFGKLDNSYVSISTSGGTGLGLYISKNLVDLMHGRIWASSEGLGRGATFTVSLPVASPETVSSAKDDQARAKGEAKQSEPVAI